MSTSREPERLPGARRRARERALALLYEAEAKSTSPSEVVRALPLPAEPYAAALVDGVARRGAEIDRLIAAAASGWRLERMPVVDRQLLRLGTFELLERTEVPVAAGIRGAGDRIFCCP